MAAARETNTELIKPVNVNLWPPRRGTLGATVAKGEIVALQTDGKWDPANTTSQIIGGSGIALQAGGDGDVIDIQRHGPVVCLTGATIGAVIYATDTAGEPAETAGTKTHIIGYAETATILFVQPVQISQS
jgi:hypothetical protein